jgi:ABC-type dipeptide/oligopeptide/nickel transport system permease component
LMRVMPGDALIALMGESGNVGEKELARLRKDLGLDRPITSNTCSGSGRW